MFPDDLGNPWLEPMNRRRGYTQQRRKAPASGPLLSDTFTDVDLTNLNVHVMDVGPGWTILSGGGVILTNRAQVAVATLLAVSQSNDADVTITAILRPLLGTDNAGLGIAFRATNVNNYWFTNLDPAGDVLQIYEVNGGVFTLRASTPIPVAAQDYTMTLVLSGQSISVTVGAVNASYALAAFNVGATLHGIRAGTIGQRIDNFLVMP